jgi:(p)ppGpp synthase/HD superfamily hydrolase
MTSNDNAPRYNHTFLSSEELEARMTIHCNPVDVLRVMEAYAVSNSVHEFQRRNDGTPYFWHSTRVARILIDELGLTDPDLIIAALLHDVLEDSDTISRTVLEFNFGSYVAMIVDTLTKDLHKAAQDPDGIDLLHVDSLRSSPDECLIIKLASRLDNFRCLSFHLKRNPHSYIRNTTERYLPLCDGRSSDALAYLCQAIRTESNKFLG